MATVVLDNGSAAIKLLLSRPDAQHYYATAHNCVARSKDNRKLFIGPQLWERLKQQPQTMQLKRAHDRGYLVSWETERLIWDELFATTPVDDVLAGITGTKSESPDSDERVAKTLLVLTEPPDNLSTLQEMTDHVVFEYFGFDAFVRCPTALLASYGATPFLVPEGTEQLQYCLVIDLGFSYTHITPVVDGQVATAHVKRLDIGGKFLTNVLKESISFRHYNMMEETLLVEHIKQACCFVSLDFNGDMERARQGTLKAQYLLPDVATNTPGRRIEDKDLTSLPEDAQLLPLTSETFTIPELLFSPSDIGHPQGGLVDGIVQAIESLPKAVQGLLLGNILLLGGNCRFRNLQARLERDLRSRVDDMLDIRVFAPGLAETAEPNAAPGPESVDAQAQWLLQAGLAFAQSPQCDALKVSSSRWRKSGTQATRRAWPGLLSKIPATAIASSAPSSMLPGLAALDGPPLPEHSGPGRRRSMYIESDRSDTPRSYSPTTEEEFDSDGKPKPKRIKLSDLNRRGRRRGIKGGGEKRSRRTSEKQGSSSRAVSVKSETATGAGSPAASLPGAEPKSKAGKRKTAKS